MSGYESWIIVENVNLEQLCDFFGLEEPTKPTFRPRFGYIELPGWCVVWAERDVFEGREDLIDVSQLGFAMRLHVQEGWKSILTAARDGEVLWQVSANLKKFRINGKPPYNRRALQALASDPDNEFFGDGTDISFALAKAITGTEYTSLFEGLKCLRPKKGSPLASPWYLRGLGKFSDFFLQFGRPGLLFMCMLSFFALGLAGEAAFQLLKWIVIFVVAACQIG